MRRKANRRSWFRSPRVPGADGAVDLHLVPAYDDIAGLYLEGGRFLGTLPERRG